MNNFTFYFYICYFFIAFNDQSINFFIKCNDDKATGKDQGASSNPTTPPSTTPSTILPAPTDGVKTEQANKGEKKSDESKKENEGEKFTIFGYELQTILLTLLAIVAVILLICGALWFFKNKND